MQTLKWLKLQLHQNYSSIVKYLIHLKCFHEQIWHFKELHIGSYVFLGPPYSVQTQLSKMGVWLK